MTTDEARELIIDGINYAAIGRRTPHFTTPTKIDFSARSTTSRTGPLPSLVHGQKATSKRRWLCYFAGPTRLTAPFRRFRMHKASSNARTQLLGTSSAAPSV
jgi:hypothetical protein